MKPLLLSAITAALALASSSCVTTSTTTTSAKGASVTVVEKRPDVPFWSSAADRALTAAEIAFARKAAEAAEVNPSGK